MLQSNKMVFPSVLVSLVCVLSALAAPVGVGATGKQSAPARVPQEEQPPLDRFAVTTVNGRTTKIKDKTATDEYIDLNRHNYKDTFDRINRQNGALEKMAHDKLKHFLRSSNFESQRKNDWNGHMALSRISDPKKMVKVMHNGKFRLYHHATVDGKTAIERHKDNDYILMEQHSPTSTYPSAGQSSKAEKSKDVLDDQAGTSRQGAGDAAPSSSRKRKGTSQDTPENRESTKSSKGKGIQVKKTGKSDAT
jgi:hypothetical protein